MTFRGATGLSLYQDIRVSYFCSVQEIAKLVMEKDLLSPSSERKGEVEEPEPEALKDLVGRLSKLSTRERVGPPYDTEHTSTNSVAAAQQVPEERKANTMDLGASELDLGMKGIGEDNINVILQLSGLHSATQSGTLRKPEGGDRAHLRSHGGTFVCPLTHLEDIFSKTIISRTFYYIQSPFYSKPNINEVQY